LYWNIPTDGIFLYWNTSADWIVCTGISLLTDCFVLEYLYCLDAFDWNIPTEYFALEYLCKLDVFDWTIFTD
jgi:hypothetical protein